MKASEKTILRFMDGQDKKFIIPVYQRPYTWKKENCLQLLKDLTDVYKRGYETHFFGSIVYVSQNDGDCEEYSIIDGQQRITTVSLLLLAIMNYIRNNPQLTIQGINPDKIKNAYLVDEYADSEKKLKLKLVQNDDASYDALLKCSNPLENNNITVNYNYLYAEIASLSPEEITGLYKAITKLIIVSISLQPQNGDDPQLIFESLNSTGLDLEASDKVRNYVLMRMKNKEQEKFFNKYWKPLEELVTQKEMNKFIRYYLEVKTRNSVSEARIYAEFKLLHQNSRLSMDALLENMMEYASYYSEINNPVDDKEKLYRKVLQRLNKLEIKTYVPFCMDLFKANNDGDLSANEFFKALELVENYLVRREICGLQTNALNKVFIQLGAEIEKDIDTEDKTYFQAFCDELMKRSGKSRFPNNRDFEDKFSTYDLYNTKASIRKYILERLENFENPEQIAIEKLLGDATLTIEHIMPQTLTDEWKKSLGPSWELIHDKYKDTIGNLTLTAYNSDYSNLPFSTKRDMKEKGFKFSKLFLNAYIGKCNSWGKCEILERSNILLEKALKIWWLPKTEAAYIDSDEWVEWNENFDSTNKLVSQIKIKNFIIKTSNATDAFKKINEILYDIDPTVYHENKFSWASEHKEDWRAPHKIGLNMYIETNKSNEAKFSCIKEIAELMKLDSSDIQFLLQNRKNKGEFDIDKEETYYNISVGRLAYELFAKIISINAISKEEVENLKSKKFTQQKFSEMYYPVLADHRNDNQGNSNNIRYRKASLIFEGRDIYISTQWFEINRKELIAWYHAHLNK